MKATSKDQRGQKPIHYAVAHRSQEEVDSFASRYQDFDTSLMKDAFKRLGYTVTSFREPASKGASHVIYIVTVKESEQPLVFRANLGFSPYPEMTMKVEELVTRAVRAAGVPTNVILHADVSRKLYPFDYQIEEKLAGKDLETEFTGTKEDYDDISFELGAMAARIHSLTFRGFGMFDEAKAAQNVLEGSMRSLYEYVTTCLEDDIAYIEQAGLVSPATTSKILDIFKDHKELVNIPAGVLVHYDLADHNITYAGNHITGIFDWEACVVGDPVIDLASCPTWKTYYPRLEKLLAGYQTVRPLPDHFDEKMKLYTLRTALWKTVINIRRGNEIVGEKRDRLTNALAAFGL